MMKLTQILLGLALFTVRSTGFHVQDGVSRTRESKLMLEAFSRRHFLEGAGVAAASMIAITRPAMAEVSEGTSLPSGAAQFARIIRAQSDLQGIAKRVSTGASEMDKTEWNNVAQFLRKMYGVADDMKAVAGGFSEQDKKKAAELTTALKSAAKAADKSTGDQDAAAFLPYVKIMSKIVDEFLGLLQDVPDEI